jgi:hypothetical protein
MSTPKDVAELCERIGAALSGSAGHDDARRALIAVLARWVAIGALQAGDPDIGCAFARATVELHLTTQAAFDRMRAGWRDRN